MPSYFVTGMRRIGRRGRLKLNVLKKLNMETEKKDVDYFNSFGSTYCQYAAKIMRGGVSLTHDHTLRSQDYQERRKQYQHYLVKYEELIQTGKYSQEECDRMAKANPKTDFEPTSFKY